uniref:Uncharacterized protein n=1 Tax=Panagrolaimus superbus TaxID=310955 RepID=A0A914YC88_9BILA
MFSLCGDCRKAQFKNGNFNISTNFETGMTSVTIVLCKACVRRNIDAGEVLDTRIPLKDAEKEEAARKTNYSIGEINALKNQWKRPSGMENEAFVDDDEETIRFPTTPQQPRKAATCPDAPKAKKVRQIIVESDEEEI